MRILIVDDEALALSRVERLLRELGFTELFKASNATHALDTLDQQAIDVLITDIHMPSLSGMELAYQVRTKAPLIPIIFQTAHEEHALKAFDIGATDYLLKPFTKDQLARALGRATPEALKFLTKNGDEYYLLEPKSIVYIKAELSEVMVRTNEEFSYFANKISTMETLLEHSDFVRVHRSYLVNLSHVKHFETLDQSRLRFYFKDIDECVESSKEGAKLFRQRFKK
jgi:two-component system LytT family response regulator